MSQSVLINFSVEQSDNPESELGAMGGEVWDLDEAERDAEDGSSVGRSNQSGR